jgi:cytochrome c biogenesis protein CcdA
LSSDLSYDGDYVGTDTPWKKPPTIFLYLGIVSVITGLGIGIFGIVSISGSSSSQQYIFGAIGYILTALVPIVFLQIIRQSHNSALAMNEEEPYDIYAGQQLQSKFLKVVLIGLISAACSIVVFFWPIAERLA